MQVCGRAEGAISTDGRVSGTYLHGIFASDAFRAAFTPASKHLYDLNFMRQYPVADVQKNLF